MNQPSSFESNVRVTGAKIELFSRGWVKEQGPPCLILKIPHDGYKQPPMNILKLPFKRPD